MSLVVKESVEFDQGTERNSKGNVNLYCSLVAITLILETPVEFYEHVERSTIVTQ